MFQRLFKFGFGLVGIEPGETLIQFLTFSIIGTIGMVVDLLFVFLAYDVAGVPFRIARVVGFIVALTTNFALNRRFTFRDKNNGNLIRQYSLFFVICSIGFLINWVISVSLFEQTTFFHEHYLLAAFFGSMGGLAINFTGSKYIAFR
ncbi:MAG TPA: GtrA family protein [Spirochaetota bacterium]|jgi:dolichol-phosphate mannosyltransferase|nr:MAG: GtrA-like protein [Spirochaetes bacterium ADurb.BinA120]HNU91658.1 GtrA family protein [Spirochaetota bacterium]HPI13888.1 GtrA family protein [Spirochaetota bacterium]HPO44473.1 GtrA family protein [Spirochaetota bacterium]HPV98258.1 GtrA family protein [Spirochaetota bacterium]